MVSDICLVIIMVCTVINITAYSVSYASIKRSEKAIQELNDRRQNMNALLARYKRAISRIGGAPALIDLPEQIKAQLRNTTDLLTKTTILEAIADAKLQHQQKKSSVLL